jgi:hypothetical protein
MLKNEQLTKNVYACELKLKTRKLNTIKNVRKSCQCF